MSLTAVQELTGDQLPQIQYRSRLIYGAPVARSQGRRGPVALFLPGKLVAYELEIGRRNYAFLFRTIARSELTSCVLAGVRPDVRLLISAVGARQVGRLKEFLALVDSFGYGSPSLSDEPLLRTARSLFSARSVAHVVDAILNAT